jgi:hypothetical protein
MSILPIQFPSEQERLRRLIEADADAESLLLLKLLAFRPLDQEDIRGILTKNAGALDLDWVRREAAELGLEEQRLGDFEQLVQSFYRT